MRTRLAAAAALLLLTACSTGEPAGPGERRGDADPEAGAAIEGVVLWEYEPPEHSATDVTYEMAPPAYGEHWVPRDEQGRVGWLDCDVYDEPVPEEFAVHSMEHGAVWLTYREGVDAAPLEELTRIVPDHVLVSPYPEQASPVVATTWDAQLAVDSPDDPRLAEFVEAWAGGPQGREPGAPCAGGTELADAQQAVADAPDGATVPEREPLGR